MNKFLKKMLMMGSVVSLMAIPVGALVGCGSKVESSDIGYVPYSATDSFVSTITNKIKTEAEANKLSISIGDGSNDQAKEKEVIDSFIASGVKVLAVNLVTPDSGGNVIAQAKAANIPLILFNKEIPIGTREKDMQSYDKVWYVGSVATASGDMEAQLAYDDIKAGYIRDIDSDKAFQFGILQGEKGHADAIARTEHCQSHLIELLNANPIEFKNRDGSVSTILGEGGKAADQIKHIGGDNSSNWSSAEGLDLSSAIVSSNRTHLEAIFCNNDDLASGAVTTIQKDYIKWDASLATKVYSDTDKNYLPIYGVDATTTGIENVKSGWQAGTVFQPGTTQAVVIAKVARNILDGKPALDGLDALLGKDKYKWEENVKTIRISYEPIDREKAKTFKAA